MHLRTTEVKTIAGLYKADTKLMQNGLDADEIIWSRILIE